MVGGESSAVKRPARDREIADCGFDSRPGNALLCPWEKTSPFFSIGAKQSMRCGGPA